jgi:hypothetical protein
VVLTVDKGHDLYRVEINDELQRYFDRYAKGIMNGWEDTTPPVRLSLLGFDHQSSAETVVERPESTYPLERQELRTFFLDAASRSLKTALPAEEGQVTYESHHLTDGAVRTFIVQGRSNRIRTFVSTLIVQRNWQAIQKQRSGCLLQIVMTWT